MSDAPRFAHPPATWLDPADGRSLAPLALMQRLAAMEVVLLGETHDIAEIHRWQLQVATCLHLLRPNLCLGFEMFPRRLQPVLDRWVEGGLDTAGFLAAAEWDRVWGFPPAIYLPLFHFCRQQRVRMLALNCERPLVTRIGRDGWDSVPAAERDGMTPAAAPTPGHRAHLAQLTGRTPEEVTERFIRAQQVWDRAFACNIRQALDRTAQGGQPPLVVGIVGRGHCEFGHGTPHQLRDLGVTRIATLLPTEADSHDPVALQGIGDALFRLSPPEPPAPRLPRG